MWIDTDYPGLGKRGVGGHGHNDVTSIIIDLNGKEFICDHGITSYFIDIKKETWNDLHLIIMLLIERISTK